MKVYDAFTGVSAVAAGKNQNQGNQSQNGFDLLFAEVSRRSVAETTFDTHNRGRDDDRSRTRTNEARTERTDRTTRREDASRRRTDDANSANDAPVVNDTAPANTTEQTTAPDEVKIDEEQAIANVAAILQVPVEVIVDLMEQQGMSAQDLLDSQAVLKLIQMAKGAESPAALLTDPVFPEQYKAINESMVELLEEAEIALALTAQSMEAGAKVQKEQGLAYAADLEGLEVINENGKLVVTDGAAGDEVYADTTRTQSTQNTETTTTTEQQQLQSGGQVQEGSTLPTLGEVVVDDAIAINPTLQTDTTKPQVETVKPAAPTPTLNATDVIEQIMSQVRVTQVGGQFTEMRMTLRPETLGDIVLRVLTQNGIVVAQFEAESQRVKETLEANFNQLRDALEEQGIAFSELSVSVRQDENERMNQMEHGRQRVRNRIDSVNGEEIPEETQSIDPYHNGYIDITA